MDYILNIKPKEDITQGYSEYIIQHNGNDIGDMYHTDHHWVVDIPYANIKIHGRYRFDLLGDAEIKYRRFLQRGRS